MENNGYFIKKLRLSKNLTQSQLAEGILSKNFLSRYERGESQVNDSTFLRLLERMNIYFSEFEELFQGENSQKEFLNEVIKAKKENDAYLWEVLKKREEEAFEKSKNIRHLHNKILMEAFLAEMDGQTLSKISKRQILNYLFDIENWGLYEIELFGNFTIFFSPEENHQFVHLLRKKKNHFSSERRYIEIASKLLLNILLKDILLGSKYGDDILKEIKKLSEKVSSRVKLRSYVGNNVSIMVRFSDFKTITRSKKIPEFICDANDIFNYAWELLLEHYDFTQGIRLLGVSLNEIKKVKELKVQLDIFDKKDYKEEEKLRKLSKKLKAEFGDTIITDFENFDKKDKSIITTSFSKDFLD